MRQTTASKLVLDAVDDTSGSISGIYVKDFRSIVFALAAADGDTGGAATGTVKFKGAISDTMPAFGTAQSASNRWDYVAVNDLEDAAKIDGDTGVAFTDNDVRLVEVNTNGLTWLSLETLMSVGYITGEWVGFYE